MVSIYEMEKNFFSIIERMNENEFNNFIDKKIFEYYKYFIEDDKENFYNAYEVVALLENSEKYNNVPAYMNYRRVVILHKLLKILLKNDLVLCNPDGVEIHQSKDYSDLFNDERIKEILEEEKDYL